MVVWKTPDQVETELSLNAVPCQRISGNGQIVQTIDINMVIIYMEILLNTDWLRKRAIFLNHEDTFGNLEGMIT